MSSTVSAKRTIPRHGRSLRHHSTPHSTVSTPGNNRSCVQIFRLNITANGDTAHNASVKSARPSSIRRRAQSQSG